jgi:hypothetical protein
MSEIIKAPGRRAMTGYFTQFRWIRGQTLEELERRLGYRRERLSSKGALLYRFLRLPNLDEFEVRGTTIFTETAWQTDVAPQRRLVEAGAAAYHRNTKVPTADEVQRRMARTSFALEGPNMLIKVFAKDWRSIDSTPLGYFHGSGVSQWCLSENVSSQGLIQGELVPCNLSPGCSVPWKL